MNNLWFRLRNKYRSNRYFYRLISFGLLVLVVPIIIVVTVTYKTTTDSLENEIIQSYVDMLDQIQQRVDERLANINQTLNPYMLNSDIQRMAYINDEPKGIGLKEIQTELKEIEQTIPNTHSVTIHMPEHNTVLTNNRFIKNMSYEVKSIPPPVNDGKWKYQESNNYNVITYTRNLPLFNDESLILFSIHLNSQVFREILDSVEILSKGGLMIVNENSNVVFSYGNFEAKTDKLFNKINSMDNVENNEQRFLEVDSNHFLVAVKSERTGWYSTLLMPTEVLKPQENKIITISIIVTIIAITIGIILILIKSRKLYQPIQEWLADEDFSLNELDRKDYDEWKWLRNKWDSLKDQHNRNIPLLKKSFLQSLLNGEYALFDKNKQEQQLKDYEIDKNKKCIVIIIQTNRKNYNDEWVHYLAGKMVVKDLVSQLKLEGDVIQNRENHYTICVLYFSDLIAKDQIKKQTYQLSNMINSTFESYYSTSATIGLGSLQSTPLRMNESYLEAKQAMQYKILYANKNILDFEYIKDSKENKVYPFLESENIISAIKNLNKEKTEQHFEEFLKIITKKKYDDNTIKRMFLILYDVILHSLNEVSQKVFEEIIKFDMLNKIEGADSIEDIKNIFKNQWFPYLFELLHLEKQNKNDQLVEVVEEYVLDTINQDHSLSAVAELVGLNPSYFSRVFTKQSGMNFVQFVAKLKVKKAMEMLSETDETVKVIAENVGYTEQTFRRVFKNETGMTPSQYRKSQK